MTFRGIIAGVFLLLATPISASEYCELILKEDFRETSNIKLVYHDGGVALEQNSPIIDKIRFGSPAAKTNLQSGDRITSINNFRLPNNEEEAFQKIISILEPLGVRDVILEVTHPDESSESVQLSKNSYLGHPIVEIDMLFNDLEVTQQSSKSNLDLDIHLKWNNDRLIYILSRLLEIPDGELNCQFQKTQELDNILKKIWYPTFNIDQIGSSIESIQYESLLITNDKNKPYGFQLIQQVEFLGKNKSDFRKFPFDHIALTAAFEFQDSDLSHNKLYRPELIIKKGNEILYEWKITDHLIDCCDSETYGQGTKQTINYNFSLERKYFYYVLKIIMPVVFLVWLSFSVFFIHAKELESKLAVSMGSLLTLVAYNFVFGDDVPKLNYITILDAWILLSYLFAGLSTMITIYSYYDYHRDKQTGTFNTLDKKFRIIVPASYHALMLILYWGLTTNWSLTPTPLSV